jgi:regulatory protein
MKNQKSSPKIYSEGNLSQAFNRSIKYLTYRIRSAKEIADYLSQKGFDEKTIAETIGKLLDLKFLNDLEFGRIWIESRQKYNGKSKYILRNELQQKGLDKELIDKLLGSAQDDLEIAKQLFEKKKDKLKGLSNDKFFKKMAGFLGRKGFSYDIIKKVIDNK